MTLRVRDKAYEVVLNGSDYVTKDKPNKNDFRGVFTAYADSEKMENMALAGISQLDDGWHISLYYVGDNVLLNFGDLEDGEVAQFSHKTEDCIIHRNRLFSVIAEISEGNKLVDGGNIEPTTIHEELRKIREQLVG